MEVWSSVKAAVAEVADKARANIEQALLDEDLGIGDLIGTTGESDDEGRSDDDELAIYKNLLTDAQNEQVKMTREYTKLVTEQQREIARLRKDLGKTDDESSKSNLADSDTKVPSVSEDARELKKALSERERHHKNALRERNKAIVSRELMVKKFDALEVRTQRLEETLRQDRIEFESISERGVAKERTHEADMERLVAEYSKLVKTTSDREDTLKRRIAELSTECLQANMSADREKTYKKRITDLVSEVLELQGGSATSSVAGIASKSDSSSNGAIRERTLALQEIERMRTSEALLRQQIDKAEIHMRAETEKHHEARRTLEVELRAANEASRSSGKADAREAEAVNELRAMRETVDRLRTALESTETRQREDAQQYTTVRSDLEAELSRAAEVARAAAAGRLGSFEEETKRRHARACQDLEVAHETATASMRRREAEALSSIEVSLAEARRSHELEIEESTRLRLAVRETEASIEHIRLESAESERKSRSEASLAASASRRAAELREKDLIEKECAMRRELESIRCDASDELGALEATLAEAEESATRAMESVREEHEESMVRARRVYLERVAEQKESASRAVADAERKLRDAQEGAERRLQESRREGEEALAKVRDDTKRQLEVAAQALERERAEADRALKSCQEKMRVAVEEAVAKCQKDMEDKVEEAHSMYAAEVKRRRAVHNKLVELQGNIRVFCRVRPIIEQERARDTSGIVDCMEYPVDGEIIVKERLRPHRYEFDAVFGPGSNQKDVFSEIEDTIVSVVDGFNVCIFAYGQTGSGKTHTMQGPADSPGVNRRALQELFSVVESRKEDWTYAISVAMLEIYNEKIRDLIAKPSGANSRVNAKNLEIRRGAGGHNQVAGLTWTTVGSVSDVMALMSVGEKNRAVGVHNMNDRSSRSHLVLQVKVEGKNIRTEEWHRGRLHLIDLAGSERVGKTDAKGQRLKEAQAINKSLSALGNVISALALQTQGKKSQRHVPFRDSKLTFLLQNSLSGNSKVLMFVCSSPVLWNAPETVCSLNFAKRCRSVQLGAATKNSSNPEVVKLRHKIAELSLALEERRAHGSERPSPGRRARR